MPKLSNTVKWGASYFSIIFLFSGFYWAAFNVNPDGFIVNKELNLAPIHDVFEYLWVDKESKKNKPPIKNLVQLQTELSLLISKLSSIENNMEELDDSRIEIEEERKLVLIKHSELLWKNTEIFENNEMKDVLKIEKVILNEINKMEEIQVLIKNKLAASTHSIKIANKRVELAEIRVKKANKNYQTSSYILSNLGGFADSGTSKSIGKLDNKLSVISSKQIAYQDGLGNIRAAMHDSLKSWHDERSNALDVFDFIYYSVGISTTTTFGDITANSRLIRALVSIQLLLSVFAIGGFVNSATTK